MPDEALKLAVFGIILASRRQGTAKLAKLAESPCSRKARLLELRIYLSWTHSCYLAVADSKNTIALIYLSVVRERREPT